MRDGVKLYCDIFRPSTDKKVPIILVWAPYGKHGNSELFLSELPERMGITKATYSDYENFEGPDPAYWSVSVVFPPMMYSSDPVIGFLEGMRL
jgi:uncharacterized protein